MARHKHCELIKAWADGAEIQVKNYDDEWEDVHPTWHLNNEYRIKPRTMKHVGWVNIYRLPGGELPSTVCCVHPSEETAKTFAGLGTVARVKVEWEETI